MKKRIFVFVIISFLVASNILSQEKAGELRLSIGPSIPVGKFAKKDVYSEKAGVASLGGLASISYIDKSKDEKKIKFTASLIGQINPVDRRSIERSFSAVKISFSNLVFWSGAGEPPSQSQNGVAYSNWKFERSSWKLGAFLAGGCKEFATNSPSVAIISKLQVGLVYVQSPELQGRSVTDTTDIRVSQAKVSALGFGYSVGAGLKMKPNNKIYFISSVDFFGTNSLTFKKVKSQISGVKNTTNPNNMVAFTSTHTGNASQTINSLNISAGIGFRL